MSSLMSSAAAIEIYLIYVAIILKYQLENGFIMVLIFQVIYQQEN